MEERRLTPSRLPNSATLTVGLQGTATQARGATKSRSKSQRRKETGSRLPIERALMPCATAVQIPCKSWRGFQPSLGPSISCCSAPSPLAGQAPPLPLPSPPRAFVSLCASAYRGCGSCPRAAIHHARLRPTRLDVRGDRLAALLHDGPIKLRVQHLFSDPLSRSPLRRSPCGAWPADGPAHRSRSRCCRGVRWLPAPGSIRTPAASATAAAERQGRSAAPARARPRRGAGWPPGRARR